MPDVNWAELARQAVEFLKPALFYVAGKAAEGALEQPGAEFYHWLKGKLTRPAAVAALAEAGQDPGNQDNLKALAIQLEKTLKEDSAFAAELLRQLPPEALAAAQHAVVIGDGSKVVQSVGPGAKIDVK